MIYVSEIDGMFSGQYLFSMRDCPHLLLEVGFS